MKTPITFFFLFVVASFAPSCSKDKQVTSTTSQLQQIKTTFSNIVWYRTYAINDASKKMTSMVDSANGQTITATFEYDANGKMVKVNFIQQAAVTHYFGFEYNPDGTIHKRQLTSGTLSVGDDYNIYAYDASGHLAVDSQFSKGTGTTYELFTVSKFYYTGANVTKAEYYTLVSGALQLQSSRQYEYDNKLNPYKNLENHYYYNEFGSAIYDIPLISDNNVINGYTATDSGAFQLTDTNTYQYNAGNYPSNLTPGIQQAPANFVKEEYLYK